MRNIFSVKKKKHIAVTVITASLMLGMTACGSTNNSAKTQATDEITGTQLQLL